MVISEAKDKTDVPVLPRYRRIPKTVDDGSENHRFTDLKAYYRQQYFEVVDIVKENASRRFQQRGFLLVRQISPHRSLSSGFWASAETENKLILLPGTW